MPKLFENEKVSNGTLHMIESVNLKPTVREGEKLDEIKNQIKESKKERRLIVKPKIAAIHAGRTRNNTIYMEDKLKGTMVHEKGPTGMYSFLYPYNKPMLKNHDTQSEPTGRVKNAQYVMGAGGSGYVMIIPHITDPETVEKVLDGRYLTVSIGATTDSAICNICGTDIIKDDWCEHNRGQEYDGTVCGWIIGDLWFDECSWVNVPADTDARVLDASDTEIYVEVGEENYDVSNGIDIKESVAEDLGLNPIEQAAEESEKDEEEQVSEDSTEENETEETQEPVIEEETVEENETNDTEDDSKAEALEPNVEEEEETENASEETSTIIEGLKNRIVEMEEEIQTLTETIKQKEIEYEAVSTELKNFLIQSVKNNLESFKLEVSLTEEELRQKSVDELRIQYDEILNSASEELKDLRDYKINNPFSNINGENGQQEETVTVIDEETPSVKKDFTPVEIFTSLLGGKNKKF